MRYGVFSRPKADREVSGDAYLVLEEKGFSLFALVDGLGSGEEAAHAARKAVECIREHRDLPLLEVLRACHSALHNTRGVVVGLLRVEEEAGRVRYAGVGNIGLWALSQEPFRPISYNGIVGYRLPRVQEFVGAYHPGDTFILYSDGIDDRFRSDEVLLREEGDPQRLAEAIARRYGRDDDVCVLVVR
ncbi:MAG: SpoIIE family protein phosphatase [Chloroflexia bacterium]